MWKKHVSVIVQQFPLHHRYCRHGRVYQRLHRQGQQRDRTVQPSAGAARAARPVRSVMESVCTSSPKPPSVLFHRGTSEGGWGGAGWGGPRGYAPNALIERSVCGLTTCIRRYRCVTFFPRFDGTNASSASAELCFLLPRQQLYTLHFDEFTYHTHTLTHTHTRMKERRALRELTVAQHGR